MFASRQQISYSVPFQFIFLFLLESFSLSVYFIIYVLRSPPSVSKISHSNKLKSYLHVSNYNGLLIFNYPMPTPCLAKDLKYNFLFLQNTSSNAVKYVCVKVSVRRNKILVVLPECQKVYNLQLTCIRSTSIPLR